MIVNINNLGQVGLISDQQEQSLPPNAFSDSLNVRFRNGTAWRVKGYESMQAITGQGLYIMPYEYDGGAYWVFATARRLYSWDGSTVTEITRTSGVLSGNAEAMFSGDVYNGIALLNNGVDVPQIWTPDDTNAADLTNWPSTWRAESIRSFKNFLVALNMTEDGTNYPTKFRWSSVADPGTVPTEWVAAATNQAGDDVIEETQGEIIDAEALRNDLIIYKSDSAYFMSFIGGQFVMQNRPALKERGILAKRCAKEFKTGQHAIFDRNDIYVHDGQTSESILKGRMYDKVFPAMDQDNYFRSYVTRNWVDDEVWFCFPETGASFPTHAAMWNWRENTWGVRELPDVTHTSYGTYPSASYSNPIERSLVSMKIDKTALYPASTLYPVLKTDPGVYYPDDGDSSLLAMEYGWDADGSNMTCTVERTGFRPENKDGVYRIREVYPHGEGGDISIWMGKQDSPNQTPTYEGPYTFTPEGTQEKINTRVTGRYLAFKIQFPVASEGKVSSVDFDIVKTGRR